MTTGEILLMTGLYLAASFVVGYFTHPTARRVVGAMLGGTVAAAIGIAIIVYCSAMGWWTIPGSSKGSFMLLLFIGTAVSCAPIYLVTWRVARRFGWRGLAVFTGIVAVAGPPRDYAYAHVFPRWMVFASGIAPVVADSVAYVTIVLVGHAVMRLISGPADQDRLATSVVGMK